MKTSVPLASTSALGAPGQNPAWHRREAAEVLRECDSSATGLSAAEAAGRLATNGPNQLQEGKRIGAFQILLRQFKSLIIWVLIVAGVVSGVMGDAMDAVSILAIVVLNAVIGFYQEFNAEKSAQPCES